MNAELLNGLNEHLKLEFRASHDYLAMSVWLASHDLPGFASWLRQQSGDELLHAQKVIDHLVDRDERAHLPAVPEPPSDWPSPEALVAQVLEHEQTVTASVNNLFALAEGSADRPAQILLQWFVNEQVEEENSARAILGRLRLAGSTGLGLLLIDQELAAGKIPGMASTTTNTATAGTAG